MSISEKYFHENGKQWKEAPAMLQHSSYSTLLRINQIEKSFREFLIIRAFAAIKK